MAPEFRVVDEEQNGVYDGHAVCEDVQNIHHVLEMRFLVAVAEILNKPHDLMGQKEDGEHDHVWYHHPHDTAVAVSSAGAFRIKDFITEEKL